MTLLLPIIATLLDALSSPSKFLATQVYSPSVSFVVFGITKVPFLNTKYLGPSLTGLPAYSHDIVGEGSPVAVHVMVMSVSVKALTLSVIFILTGLRSLLEMSVGLDGFVILGLRGTTIEKYPLVFKVNISKKGLQKKVKCM